MRKLTIETTDYNVYDFKRICAEVAKAYEWNDEYAVNEEAGTVDFRMDGLPYRGEMVGYEFEYSEVDEVDGTVFKPEGLFDWIPITGASYMVRGKDENGKDVFLAVGND